MYNTIQKTLKRAAALLLALTFIIPQIGCASNEENTNYTGISKTGFYLDTICTITIYGVDAGSELGAEIAAAADDEAEQTRIVQQLITDAFLECDRYEKLLSKTLAASEISKINTAAGQAVSVSEETKEVIEKGIGYGQLSGGLFDITIGKASDLWDFHEAEEMADFASNGSEDGSEDGADSETDSLLPDEDQLKDAVSHVDYKKISVDGDKVQLADPEMEIDLGGIAKGYIADRVTEYLEERGVISAVVDLGGNIVAIGGKTKEILLGSGNGGEDGEDDEGGEDGETENESVSESADFSIGIKDPQSEDGQLLVVFSASDKTVVTSGTYERYMMVDGVKYHHILDPKTGWPIDNDVLSVTIIAEKGCAVDADGLSTTCLALGVEKGLQLIESLTEPAVEAVFVDGQGHIYTTSGAPELTTK